MKKIFIFMAFFALVSLLAIPICFAEVGASRNLKLMANVPAATSISIVVNRVEAITDEWVGQVSGDTLDFDLYYDSGEDTFFATYYFAVDVASAGGAGTPETTLHYTEGANPNGSGETGLGTRGNATFYKAVFVPNAPPIENPIEGHPKVTFSGVQSKVISPESIAGGWLRVYLGLNTEPEGSFEVFSVGDAPGVYDGTMLISATLR